MRENAVLAGFVRARILATILMGKLKGNGQCGRARLR
jgi:hypothetical protein